MLFGLHRQHSLDIVKYNIELWCLYVHEYKSFAPPNSYEVTDTKKKKKKKLY